MGGKTGGVRAVCHPAVGTSGQLAGAGGVGIFTGIWTKFSGHLDDSG